MHQSLDTFEKAVTEIDWELGKSRSKQRFQDCYDWLLGKMGIFLGLIFGQEGAIENFGSDSKMAVSWQPG